MDSSLKSNDRSDDAEREDVDNDTVGGTDALATEPDPIVGTEVQKATKNKGESLKSRLLEDFNDISLVRADEEGHIVYRGTHNLDCREYRIKKSSLGTPLKETLFKTRRTTRCFVKCESFRTKN